MVQMKVTASVLIAAAAIAPAVAYGFEAEDSLVTREDNEFANSYARGFDLDLDEREFDDELYEREPFRGMGMVRKAKGFFRGGSHRHSAPSTPTEGQSETREFNDDDLLEREFDEELYEREPFRGMGMVRKAKGFFRGGSHRHSAPSTPTESQSETREFNDDDLLEREFDEELYEREPFRGMGMVRKAKGFFRGGSHRHSAPSTPTEGQSETREFNDDDLLEREFDEELYEREPFRGMGMVRKAKGFFRGGSHRHSAPSTPTESQSETREFNDDLFEREFDEELYEREPFRGMGMVRKAKGFFRGGSHRHSAPSTPTEGQSETREFDDELMEREFDDELFGREYDSGLFEREPEPLFGFIRKWFGKKKTAAPDAEAAPTEARDFDELD